MLKIFNLDSPVMRMLSTAADLMILNLLWLLCSIPIVTVGAATTALYYVCFQIVEGTEGSIVKSFFGAFKANFKKGTVIWLTTLVIGLFLAFDIYFIIYTTQEISLLNVLSFCVFSLFAIVWVFMFLYVFALQARFENSVKQTILNALRLGVTYPFRSLFMIIGDIVLIFLGIRFIPIIIPVLPVCFHCSIISKIFSRLSPRDTQKAISE